MGAEAAAQAAVEVRKERVHTTMLIELLALLVFMAMAFAFVSRDESEANPMREEIHRLKAELSQARQTILERDAEIRKLIKANQTLSESLRRLYEKRSGTLRANDRVVVLPQSQFDTLTGELANKEAMLNERQKTNAALLAKLSRTQGGGTDLPNCTVTAGFLLSVELLGGGGFRVRPAWSEGAAPLARQVPGAMELTAGGSLTAAQFERQAARVAEWGRSQPVPCGFRAKTTNSHSDLGLYKRQNRVVERYFYTARY